MMNKSFLTTLAKLMITVVVCSLVNRLLWSEGIYIIDVYCLAVCVLFAKIFILENKYNDAQD